MDTNSEENTESSESTDSEDVGLLDIKTTKTFRNSGEWSKWALEELANKRKLAKLEKKYKIDPEVVIEVTIDQLPKNLRMGELSAYLSREYPNKYVKIYHSPLTQYGPFLPEIISNILKQDDRYLPNATRISKAVRDKAMISYLDVECQQPVLRGELLKYLEKGGMTMTMTTNENELETFWYRDYDIEGTITPIDKTKLVWKRTKGYGSIGRIQILTRRYSISVKDMSTNVDMFTEYDILTQRKKCIELDENFAVKKLIQRYNDTIARELNKELTEEDVERVFYMAELADGLDLARGVSMTEDVMIYLSEQKKTRIVLEPIFIRSRRVIRDKIVNEHEVKVSPYNEFILNL